MATSPYRNSKIEGRSNPRGLPRRRPQVSTIEDRPTQDVPLVPSLDDVDIFEKSTIKLDRQIFSKESFNKKVNTSFEELQTKEETISPKQFFELYDSIYFNIPKLGTTSHAQLISRSREYLKGFNITDPKDERINNLLDQIAELEQALLQANQADPEHPFFRNGKIENSVTFVKDFDIMMFENRLDRVWGPGVMHELAFPLCIHLGVKKIP